tara:strand:- start:4250 stop:4753 length:504 start_codon:yes stop_codon:yes gene_type:complete
MVFDRILERKRTKFAMFLAVLFGLAVGMFVGGFVGTYAIDSTFDSRGISSFDHITEDKIYVAGSSVFIDVGGKQLKWSKFDDTNSMKPLFDVGHNGLEFVPRTEEDIHIGDIVAFVFGGELFVHRVVDIDYDSDGWFALTKGDNLGQIDPGKRRFDDITGVMFGVVF